MHLCGCACLLCEYVCCCATFPLQTCRGSFLLLLVVLCASVHACCVCVGVRVCCVNMCAVVPFPSSDLHGLFLAAVSVLVCFCVTHAAATVREFKHNLRVQVQPQSLSTTSESLSTTSQMQAHSDKCFPSLCPRLYLCRPARVLVNCCCLAFSRATVPFLARVCLDELVLLCP